MAAVSVVPEHLAAQAVLLGGEAHRHLPVAQPARARPGVESSVVSAADTGIPVVASAISSAITAPSTTSGAQPGRGRG